MARQRLLPLVLGVSVALTVGTTLLVLSPAPWTMRGDNGRVVHPMTVAAHRALRAGTLPEWSASMWGGYPLVAEVNAAPLYLPHHLAILLTPSPHLRAYDSAFALHAGLLASGTARLLLLIGVSAAAATLGGVLVALLPLPIWWAAGMLMVYAAFAWWPWIWVASEHLARRTPTRRLWLASGGGRASPSLLSGRAPEARVAPISCSSACSQ